MSKQAAYAAERLREAVLTITTVVDDYIYDNCHVNVDVNDPEQLIDIDIHGVQPDQLADIYNAFPQCTSHVDEDDIMRWIELETDSCSITWYRR